MRRENRHKQRERETDTRGGDVRVCLCLCVCTHACSICPWNLFHVYSEFQLLGRIHSRWVCSRSHGSLLHCLELDSTRDGGKLLNTIKLSRCIVNETKAGPAWPETIKSEVDQKSPAALEWLPQCQMWPCFWQHPWRVMDEPDWYQNRWAYSKEYQQEAWWESPSN